MDDLITPPKELDPQERVMQTMELQTDTQLQVEKFGEKMTYWDQTLAPQEPAENTDDSQVIIVHIQTVLSIFRLEKRFRLTFMAGSTMHIVAIVAIWRKI